MSEAIGEVRLDRSAVHVVVDMQRVFAEPGPWFVPWMPKVLPHIVELARRHPARTVFTRFIPPPEPADMPSAWRDYYRHWRAMTQENLDERLLDLVDPLRVLVPPAQLCDKAVYSAFGNPGLPRWLAALGVRTLVVSGGETDVCGLATVIGHRNGHRRPRLPCRAADRRAVQRQRYQPHALLTLWRQRFAHQVTTVSTEEIPSRWE